MSAEERVSLISWQQLFVLGILCIGTFVVFKQLDRYVVTGGNLVNPSLSSFHIDSKTNAKNVLVSDTSIILSSDQEEIVSVWNDIAVPSVTKYIKVSATIKTKNVDTGKNYWDGARVVFVEMDGDGKFDYHKPHIVDVISGDINNVNVSRMFSNEKDYINRRLLLELHNVSGEASFSNVEVYGMNVSANFILMRIIVSGLWLASIAAYFFFTTKKITRKGLVVSALLILIALGALVPGDVKMYINQSVSLMLCVFDFCHFSSIANQYPNLIKYGFIYESGIINVFKFGHLILFATMSLFLMWVADKTMRVKIAIFMLLLAASTEILQMMFFTRTPSLHDLYIDITGILIGLVLALLLFRTSHREKYKQVLDV